MDTSSPTPTSRPPVRAYHAQFHGLAGILTKPGDHVLFLESESGAVVTLTDADQPHLVVLGEVAAAMMQYVQDQLRGGAASICTQRAQEVQ